MKTIYLTGRDPYIIGQTGESNAVTLRVDVTEWKNTYSDGRGILIFHWPNKTVYPLDTNLVQYNDKYYLEAIVTSNETRYPGWVVVQAQWYDGETLAYSRAFSCKVLQSHDGYVPGGDTVPTWVTELLDKLDTLDVLVEAAETITESKEAAQEAAESAGGHAAAAELSAQDAAGSADEAEGQAENAEAWAQGTRGGTAVPSTDGAYNKHAKYWANQAAASASAAMQGTPEGYASIVGHIAGEFDPTAAYAAGDYVWNQAKLYRFTADHAAGEWTGTDAKELKVSDGLSDVKGEINNRVPLTYSNITWKNGTVVADTGVIGDSTTRIISDGFIFARAGSRLGLNNYTDYKIGIAMYWAPSVNCFSEYHGFNDFKNTYVIENDCYIVPTCAFVDNRTITDDNRPTLVSAVEWEVFSDSIKNKVGDHADGIARIDTEISGAGTQPVWQIGSVNSTSGEINPLQTNRMTMTTPVRALNGSKITLKDTEHYRMAIAEYSYDGSVYEITGYHTFTEALTEYTVPADCYVRVVLKWVNDDKSFNASYLGEYAKAVSLDLISDGGLMGRVAELEKATTQKHTMSQIKSTDWMIRGMNSADGSILIGANNRITTKWFLHVKAGSIIALDDYTNYQFGVASYDEETIASFTEYKGFAVNTAPVTIDNDCYIIIVMCYANNQVITNINDLTQHLILNLISAEDADSLVNDSAAVKELLKNGLSLTHRYYRGKKQYRIHVDEVIWALWDLAQHNYTSVFEQSEFADYKRIHDQYGTCFVLSLHYKQQQGIAWHAPVPAEMIGWTLEEMPDTWRSEFIENADWLKFSFHTYAYEYRYEPGATDRDWEQDILDMRAQVVRFAGEETWIDEIVKTHGVLGDQELIRTFMKHGAKWFEGDAEHVEANDPDMQTYYLTDEQQNKMFAEGTYYDPTNKALFFASAGNLERLYGFVSGTIDMAYYLDNYVYNPSYRYHKKCDYMTFCSHESPMLGGMVIVVNGVATGDSITINGRTYTAGTDFAVGTADGYTAQNLYAVLDSSVIKHMQSANLLTIYGTLGNKSDSFVIRTPMQQIEVVAKWCQENGWEGHHLDESSFYKF